MQDPNPGTARPRAASQSPHPTDFLAFSRQYAADMGLPQDIGSWQPQEFQAFLDWWLMRTKDHFVQDEAES